MAGARYVLILVALAALGRSESLKFWVQPCDHPETHCRTTDPELAQWALEAWQAASDGKLTVIKTSDKAAAQIRIYWITDEEGLYGEARGGDVFVRPDPGEGLLRETTVYLTCLHETGHALGLRHTAAFADIMYSFQYGGDLEEYFGRYRRKLTTRDDIRKNSGISHNDRKQMIALGM